MALTFFNHAVGLRPIVEKVARESEEMHEMGEPTVRVNREIAATSVAVGGKEENSATAPLLVA